MPSRDELRQDGPSWEWRGDDVVLVVHPETLAGELQRPSSGARWSFAGVERGVGSGFVLETVEHGERGCRAGVRLGTVAAEVEIALLPDDDGISIRVAAESSASLTEPLAYPPPLRPVGQVVTELALPIKTTQGIVHHPGTDTPVDFTFDVNGGNSEGLSMPFWSLSGPGGALLTILDTPDDVALTVAADSEVGVTVQQRWLASLGTFGCQRSVRYLPVDEGYQAVALHYRQHVVASGRFRTLADKVAERPAVQGLVGAPYFSTGYLPWSGRKLRQVLAGLQGLGYRSGLLGPIDYLQWDSEPWLNDYQPFIHAPDFAPVIAEAGFTPFAWFYLEDILDFDPSFDPAMLAIGADGTTGTGWQNRDYRFARVCDAVLTSHGRRLRGRADQFVGLHFDTTTCKELMECWSPDHPMTRSQDREARHDWLAEVAGWGHVVGSEGGCDWAFDVMDFCSNNPRRGLKTAFPGPAAHVPLQGLVYHDSVISYGWEYDPYNPSYWGGDWSRAKLLYDVMCGNPPTVSPVLGYFPVISGEPVPVTSSWVSWEDPQTQQLLRAARGPAQLHGLTAFQPLTEHRYLDDQRLVSRTVFGSGTEVLVNFGVEAFDDGDCRLDAATYSVDGRLSEQGAG